MTLEMKYRECFNDGKDVGMQEGIIAGEKRKAVETARNLVKMNLTPEQISQATGLSPEEVKKLAEEK